jgi:nitrogen regulatory protein P-II 1
MLDAVVDTIQKNAHTGNKGDGKIFIYDVKNAIRIMTGEHGEAAV